jgi:hypothetical protein
MNYNTACAKKQLCRISARIYLALDAPTEQNKGNSRPIWMRAVPNGLNAFSHLLPLPVITGNEETYQNVSTLIPTKRYSAGSSIKNIRRWDTN